MLVENALEARGIMLLHRVQEFLDGSVIPTRCLHVRAQASPRGEPVLARDDPLGGCESWRRARAAECPRALQRARIALPNCFQERFCFVLEMVEVRTRRQL